MQDFSNNLISCGKRIGFVPTMGYLHKGHLSLVETAYERCDEVVVSIFVNPTQFAPNEDLSKYPRDEENDLKLLREHNVSAVFFPDVEEIYQDNFQTYVDLDIITKKQEGEFRPDHFKGVTTIVSILFNCVKPHLAVFGQKDAQQAAVISRMINDLKFDIEMIISPIVREKDGLAMSSRNVYLRGNERVEALVLRRSLDHAVKMILKGTRDVAQIISGMKSMYESVESANLQYIRIVESESFKEVNELVFSKGYYILIACKIGNTRLIDNELITI